MMETHPRFGYNGSAFNARTEQGTFWVEYGDPVRQTYTVVAELMASLRSIHDHLGLFAIYNTGSLASRLAIWAANRAEVPFVELVLEVAGYERPTAPAAHVVRASLDLLENTIITRAPTMLFPTVNTCVATFVGEKIDIPVVYDSTWLYPIDLNYDFPAKTSVGPSNWCFIEYESSFTVADWLIRQGRIGIPSIYRCTPEMVKSQANGIEIKTSYMPDGINNGMNKLAQRVLKDEGRNLFNTTLRHFSARLYASITKGKTEKVCITPVCRIAPELGLPDCGDLYGKLL
jgi:hypothetical protein